MTSLFVLALPPCSGPALCKIRFLSAMRILAQANRSLPRRTGEGAPGPGPSGHRLSAGAQVGLLRAFAVFRTLFTFPWPGSGGNLGGGSPRAGRGMKGTVLRDATEQHGDAH